MDLFAAFAVFALAMVLCLAWGASYAMLLALAVGLLAFYTVARLRGFMPRDLLRMIFKGLKRSLIVVRIMVLIGLLTALWRSGGTITYFVYHGIRLIPPGLFLLAGFVLTCLLAYALGTSFGVVGTVGVILMTLARSGGVPPALMAGAVLRGAYFGDRTAPASSSANLVATVTETRLYDNVRAMLKSCLVPMALCGGLYGLLSLRYPLTAGEGTLLTLMEQGFDLSWLCALPAVVMVALPLCRLNVRFAIIASSACAFVLSIFVQDLSLGEALRTCVFGYQPTDPVLAGIFAGGGLLSMVKVAGIVALSGTFSGIFEGTRMLEGLQEKLSRLAEKLSCCGVLLLSSVGIIAVFCNQTIGIMMAQQLLGPVYEKRGKTNSALALDIENTMVVMVGLCPWCIACAFPLEMMGVGIEALPWAALLYLLPLWWLLVRLREDRKKPPEA